MGADVWPPAWREVDEDEGEALAAAIDRDLAPTHILYGRAFTVIARREDSDDVLLVLDDGEVAEMHMSWAALGGAGSFPGALLFMGLDQWLEAQF